jgi:uncharacterized protein YndB with AHSA1/START domain
MSSILDASRAAAERDDFGGVRALELDRVMPSFDATRVEHRIIDGSVERVYTAVLQADFVRTWKHRRSVRTLFAMRNTAERLACRLQGHTFRAPEEPKSLRLDNLRNHGEWVTLARRPPHEICFGAIGRFWGGETVWRESGSSEFAAFSEPRYARIACNFSLRAYGEDRTLISYESRTQATDPQSRRAFLRYWRLVAPLVGVVMRAQLAVIAEEATRPG